MQIKEDRLQQFIELYEREFGVQLSISEATEKATRLLQYVYMCLKPLAKVSEDDITDMPNVSE
ncbi:hypothetical protein [Mucilaginibacter flavus]|uniref:hypothetical protein n=1 Tax=Mucilaginibacter flavus TaxID=931504 RepID=UPI0025B4D2FD|nr:hypothetical protein [Mucilaginibacter flavus]MDN3581882.1 hypothetical protein [Mucilaginibacter flavus]